MKYLLFLFLFASSNLIAQSEEAFFNALRFADVKTMENYLQDNIDFCLMEDQQILSKKVAMGKLKSFLDTNKTSGIELMHKGTSKDKSTNYKVAKLTTSTGSFRVFVYSVGNIGPKSVKEIRIDKF